MEIGDRVRVKESVVVYHHPQHKQEGIDIQGQEGEIIEVIGKPISANFPIKVKFAPKFTAHLREQEIERI